MRLVACCTSSSTTRSVSPRHHLRDRRGANAASAIFHVNGEDPEAVAQVVRLALDFRAEFQSDVFIDMYGYRRLGHNETDEPAFTQPLLYKKIAARPNVREGYLGAICSNSKIFRAKKPTKFWPGVTQNWSNNWKPARADQCEIVPNGAACGVIILAAQNLPTNRTPAWKPKKLSALLHKLTELPAGFHIHPKTRTRNWRRGAKWRTANIRSIGPPPKRLRSPRWRRRACAFA